MEAEPKPIRIHDLDLEGDIGDLHADGRYERAWVVGRLGGVPQTIVEVDLTDETASGAAQVKAMFDRPLTARPSATPAVGRELPRISIVVPSVVARIDELERCLEGLGNLCYADYEIIIVDNRRALPEADRLPDLLAHRPGVRVVRAVQPGISAARNAGLAVATGEIVVFTDDDVQVDPEWLNAFGRRFAADPGLDAVTGLILPAELDTPAQIYFERYYGGFSGERTFQPLMLEAGSGPIGRARVVVRDLDGREVRRFSIYGVGAYGAGANMAFRKVALERRGGFDTTLGTGTAARGGEDLAALIDVLWSGGAIGYEPAAVVHHQHRRSLEELLHQLDGNGTGFTAMLVSLIRRDRRHLLGLLAQLPLAAQRMAFQSLARARGQEASGQQRPGRGTPARYPSTLVLHELRGMCKGPVAFYRSLRSTSSRITEDDLGVLTAATTHPPQ